MISPTFAFFGDNVGAFPIRLELLGLFFCGIFENSSEDKCSSLEDTRPCLAIVMGSRPLLVGGHPDECTFSHFIRQSRFLPSSWFSSF